MTETILIGSLNFVYWSLLVIWPACTKPRLAGRRQELWHLELHFLFFFFSLSLQLIQDI